MALQDKKIMPPPWLAHREIERYSIGWRMGYGEDYIYRFGDWLDTLSPDERTEYRTLFPEPVTWKGWWEDEDSGEVLEHGDFLVDAWQPEGRPKYTRQWLQQEFAAGRKRELCLFWGHQLSEDGQLTKSCLSQWWMEDFYTTAESYLCMEQYMMAAKAELFGDKEIRDQILKCSDQKQIKALGRKVRGFEQKVWDKFKYAIVLLGNWHKFSQNRELREFLLSTGDSVLVEASPYDAIWGIRLSAGSPEAQDPMKWRGQNLLGFALMEVRDELRRVTQNEMLCDWSTKGEAIPWAEWSYKVGDPILFNDSKRFDLLYNNLKGRIVDIEKHSGSISFTVDVEIPLTELMCKRDGIEFIESIENGTRIRFAVYEYDESKKGEDLDENLRLKSVVPFQLAYAVSIHKAQGLEYDSVKVIIPSNNAEKITHGIFYTAITRAKTNLKIYWSSETMHDVVTGFATDESKRKSLEIVKTKLGKN